MADYSAVANRLLRAASSAAGEQTDEEEAFESLVNATRRNFRPDVASSRTRRGRKRKESFSRKVFLAKLAHIDFLPGKTEQGYLKNRGLGEGKQPLVVNRQSSIDTIKENILTIYPNNIQNLLRMSGYRLAKCDRSKKISFMQNIQNALDLERQLGCSKIIIVPNNDFPHDLPINNELHENATESITTSTTENSLYRPHSLPPTTSAAGTSHSSISQDTNENLSEVFNFEGDTVNQAETNNSVLSLPTLNEEADILSIEMSRSNCVFEMFNIYSDETVVEKRLNVKFKDELGVDGGGLTKELFNIFFKEIECQYFRGEDCLIPFLELNKMKEKDSFIIIGRILEHMLLLTGTIPSKMSKIILLLVADPVREVDEKLLLDELSLYVNPCLRFILKKAIEDFSTLREKELEILQDFFQSSKFFEMPSSEKIKEQLLLIGAEILIETPRRLIETLRKGISLNKNDFWTKCDFATLLDMQKPTPTKVANCVVTDGELSNEENRILHYLDMYIRCLSNDNVGSFLFMITGSFMMPYSINVKFNDLVGLSQRPIFSTCTDTLFLPRTYPSYQDLKNDLNTCLQSEEAKVYSSY